MALNPIYTPENTNPVHELHFSWVGWLKNNKRFPPALAIAIQQCKELWASEGIFFENWDEITDQAQLLLKVAPSVSPAFFNQRIKGRLQYALRKLGAPVDFKRNNGFRSVGKNTREVVQAYIAKQSRKSDYIDPKFKEWLEQFHVDNRPVVLRDADTTGHGRYWYALHLVLVVENRKFPMERRDTFGKARDYCMAIAKKKGYEIAELFVMPDHIHIALRGNIEHSSQDIALSFLNNLSYVFGYNRVWSEEYYVGTFGEYRLDQV